MSLPHHTVPDSHAFPCTPLLARNVVFEGALSGFLFPSLEYSPEKSIDFLGISCSTIGTQEPKKYSSVVLQY